MNNADSEIPGGLRKVELSGVAPFIAAFSLLMSLLGGVCGGMFGGALGALCAHIGRHAGDTPAAIFGAIGTNTITFVALFSLTPKSKWRYVLLGWMSATFLVYVLNSQIPQEREWRFFRWAIAGAGIGVLVSAFFEPVRLFRTGEMVDLDDRSVIFVLTGYAFGYLIEMFAGLRIGHILAGVIGGGLGGLFVGWMATYVAPDGACEFFGGDRAVLFEFSGLGALGGAIGGWTVWSIFTRPRWIDS